MQTLVLSRYCRQEIAAPRRVCGHSAVCPVGEESRSGRHTVKMPGDTLWMRHTVRTWRGLCGESVGRRTVQPGMQRTGVPAV